MIAVGRLAFQAIIGFRRRIPLVVQWILLV